MPMTRSMAWLQACSPCLWPMDCSVAQAFALSLAPMQHCVPMTYGMAQHGRGLEHGSVACRGACALLPWPILFFYCAVLHGPYYFFYCAVLHVPYYAHGPCTQAGGVWYNP